MPFMKTFEKNHDVQVLFFSSRGLSRLPKHIAMFPKTVHLSPINHNIIIQIIQLLIGIYKTPQNNYTWAPVSYEFLCDTEAIVFAKYGDGCKKRTQSLPVQIVHELLVQLFKPSPHPVTESYVLVHSPESMVPFDKSIERTPLPVQNLHLLVQIARSQLTLNYAQFATPLFHPFVNGHASLVCQWFFEAGVSSYEWEQYKAKRAKLLTSTSNVSLVAYFRWSLSTKIALLFALVNFTKSALQKHPEFVKTSGTSDEILFHNLVTKSTRTDLIFQWVTAECVDRSKWAEELLWAIDTWVLFHVNRDAGIRFVKINPDQPFVVNLPPVNVAVSTVNVLRQHYYVNTTEFNVNNSLLLEKGDPSNQHKSKVTLDTTAWLDFASRFMPYVLANHSSIQMGFMCDPLYNHVGIGFRGPLSRVIGCATFEDLDFASMDPKSGLHLMWSARILLHWLGCRPIKQYTLNSGNRLAGVYYLNRILVALDSACEQANSIIGQFMNQSPHWNMRQLLYSTYNVTSYNMNPERTADDRFVILTEGHCLQRTLIALLTLCTGQISPREWYYYHVDNLAASIITNLPRDLISNIELSVRTGMAKNAPTCNCRYYLHTVLFQYMRMNHKQLPSHVDELFTNGRVFSISHNGTSFIHDMEMLKYASSRSKFVKSFYENRIHPSFLLFDLLELDPGHNCFNLTGEDVRTIIRGFYFGSPRIYAPYSRDLHRVHHFRGCKTTLVTAVPSVPTQLMGSYRTLLDLAYAIEELHLCARHGSFEVTTPSLSMDHWQCSAQTCTYTLTKCPLLINQRENLGLLEVFPISQAVLKQDGPMANLNLKLMNTIVCQKTEGIDLERFFHQHTPQEAVAEVFIDNLLDTEHDDGDEHNNANDCLQLEQ
jgi:hypothetical protein